MNRALAGEKRRLSTTLAELARLKHGIDQLADEPTATAPRASAAEALRQVTGEGRRARQLDRASELDLALGRILDVALEATAAHAALYFDLDRQREQAHLRVTRGPDGAPARLRGAARRRPLLVPDRARADLLRDRLQEAAAPAAVVQGPGPDRDADRGPGARRRRDRGRAGGRQAGDAGLHRRASRSCSRASPSSPPRRSAARAPRSGARSWTRSSRPSTRSRSGSRRSRASPRCASCCCARRGTSRTSRRARW